MCITLNWISVVSNYFRTQAKSCERSKFLSVQTLCLAPYRHLVAAYLKYRAVTKSKTVFSNSLKEFSFTTIRKSYISLLEMQEVYSKFFNKSQTLTQFIRSDQIQVILTTMKSMFTQIGKYRELSSKFLLECLVLLGKIN